MQASRGIGVCALVGMGGAGKTAIAERFLNELLNVGQVSNVSSQSRETLEEHRKAPNSHESGYEDLPPPHSVFVYSFYDDDKPENFFRHRQIWLEGSQASVATIAESWKNPLSPSQLMPLIQRHQGLMILDGLEKVQESGARGGFGRLTSPSLRDLLNHIACGAARELSVLVTSRFPLTDLRDSQPRFFHTIAVDQIDVAAGGYIKEYGDGKLRS
ncbi:MAG: hypothetical protein O3C40_33220 [Planctomycetota bacterium]|nr:hypothetical protein [Planctomycetota bacterium]